VGSGRPAVCLSRGCPGRGAALLKLTEEVGEAAEAFIGMHGLNSRKGVAALVMTCSTSSLT
jgi:hypothetical protein